MTDDKPRLLLQVQTIQVEMTNFLTINENDIAVRDDKSIEENRIKSKSKISIWGLLTPGGKG